MRITPMNAINMMSFKANVRPTAKNEDESLDYESGLTSGACSVTTSTTAPKAFITIIPTGLVISSSAAASPDKKSDSSTQDPTENE